MFKDIFKQLIQNSGLSSYQISKDTGISESLISHWKSGRQLPKYDSLNVLADYFNVSGDYLLGRTDNPESHINKSNIVNLVPLKLEHRHKQYSEPKKPQINLPLYPQPASAGTGLYLFDAEPVKWITIPKNELSKKADFIILVRGESMLPMYADGDKVFVEKTSSILEGEIGIFIVNGESYIKQMGKYELISINPNYDNIPLSEYTDCRYVGKVIGKVEE